MSVSDGIHQDQHKKHQTSSATDTAFTLDVQHAPTSRTTETHSNPIQYKVMMTFNEACLTSKARETSIDHIIDQIQTFYGDCLGWKGDTEQDRYTTYKVSDLDMVYFLKIIDNDKRCLIYIDMDYLSTQCVDLIEYEPIYTLDTTHQCEALDISTLNVWNLDFFDGTPGDDAYNILDNHHVDHGVDQYILDTGILSTHQIFNHNENHNLVNIGTTTPFIPSHYHGTYVAGIAGGDIYGTSRNLTIYDYEVCEGSSCSYSRVLAGIEAAKLNMITTGRRGVINLSFGGPIAATNTVAREKWDFIMKSIIDAGGIPVCSAGNTQLNGCNYVPGQSKYCISVGAFDVFGELYSRTNYGECVNIFAPGVGITSAGTGSTSEYIVRSGTSAAAPHITGLISNLLWVNPALTFDHILYIINENRQYLSSCPNNYTRGTECPYISLSCSSFHEAINTAIAHVPGASFPTEQPTVYSTTPSGVIIGDNGLGGGQNGGEEESTISPTQSDIITESPTHEPTRSPTLKTTDNPTKNPSELPSHRPVIELTNDPTTSIPTLLSTTQSPLELPTIAPTSEPTQRFQALELAGFNSGFAIDFGRIIDVADLNASSKLFDIGASPDVHNYGLRHIPVHT
eukprot:406692_1